MDKPNLESYFHTCYFLATAEKCFYIFRSYPDITSVTDTNTVNHGLECEQEIWRHHSYLHPWLNTFRGLDTTGLPKLYRFPVVGLFNPTTLRHVLTLGRISQWIDESPRHVVEIGGSYGMLAAMMLLYYSIADYTLIEVPSVAALGERFLAHAGLDFRATFISSFPDTALKSPECDLVISCYALSELDRDQQDWYIDNVLINARAGFLVMNSCSNGYPRLEMIQRLEEKLETQVICEREIPLTHKDNYTLMWKRGNDA